MERQWSGGFPFFYILLLSKAPNQLAIVRPIISTYAAHLNMTPYVLDGFMLCKDKRGRSGGFSDRSPDAFKIQVSKFQHQLFFIPLVRFGGSLASLELIQVPSTDTQVALVVVHALAEVLRVGGAGRVLPGRRGVVALVQTIVHGLRWGCLLSRSAAGAATEEAPDGVADGGTDSDTARRKKANGQFSTPKRAGWF